MLTEDMPRIMSALNAITKWIPDEDEEEEGADDAEEGQDGSDSPDKVQKHVNMISFEDDDDTTRSIVLPTWALVAVFVCLLAVVVALFSAKVRWCIL